MTPEASPHSGIPRLRADAQRNRDRLVSAARSSLSTDGGPMILEAIAKDAGVGIGTLYRHFPTREALIQEVYAAELADLTADVGPLLERLSPEDALAEWVLTYARFVARKRGMLDALRVGFDAGSITASTTRQRITGAITPIVSAGAATGTLRADVDPDDVTALLLGVFLSTATNRDGDQTQRLLDLVLDALRPLNR